jgi:hypothetical protein
MRKLFWFLFYGYFPEKVMSHPRVEKQAKAMLRKKNERHEASKSD